MQPLEGLTVLACDGMDSRPLCRFLASLGAEIRVDRIDFDSIANADLLVDASGIEGLEEQGITRAQLEAWNPALVHVSVTTFGSGSERSRWRGSELVASAMGGSLRLTGEPDRRPVKEALDACTFHAEMVAAAGATAAFYQRLATGSGQHVDVSIQEVAFSRNINGVLVWQFDRRKLQRAGGALNYGRATVRCIWRLADGWCFHSLMTGRFGAPANQALSDWIEESGLANPMRGVDWSAYNRSTLPAATRLEWETAIDAFFQQRTRADIRGEGRRRGINACVVEEPGDVLTDPHLEARGFWSEEDGLRLPGHFLRMRQPADDREPASSGELTGNTESGAAVTGDELPRPGPLAGIRILDFSWALVGSISTKILGDLGADVIKVESGSRPCLSRIDVQVAASQPGNLDDKPWFAHLNTSKRSLAIDLKKPESRQLIDPLLDWADAVVENFSPGTMDKLGLGYDALSQRWPGVVMASGSVYGQTGPLAREWGIDGTGGALSGRTFMTGWPDRGPLVPGSVPYGDVIVPYVIAAGVVAGLINRQRQGSGCHVDAAMYEICAQQMTAAIAQAQCGSTPQRSGNADPGILLQDVFPARGEDRWIAITVYDEEELARLQGLAGNQAIADWTSQHDEYRLVERLQQAGIAAGVVQDIEDMVEHDPVLRQRGALLELPHAQLGPFAHMRTPITFSMSQVMPFRAPSLGEHSLDIARTLAGLDEEQLAELDSRGVFG